MTEQDGAPGQPAPGDDGSWVVQVEQLVALKRHAEAIPLLLKARDLGSTKPDLPVLLANCYSAVGKDREAIAEVDRAIESRKAAGSRPPVDWYKFAIPKVYAAGDRAATANWLARYIQDYPTMSNWRWAIVVVRQRTPAGADTRVERLDIYRLRRATNALGDHGDYADYAYTAQQSGFPWEAVSVVEEGRKSGKIPTGDGDIQRTLTAAQASVKSEGSLETVVKQATASNTGKTAAQTGDAFLASANHARALDLYAVALQKGGVRVDEINLHRGIALRALGRGEEARAAFQQVAAGPYAGLALLWQVSIDLPLLA